MSLDRLRVSTTRTIVEGPSTYEDSALTSVTRGVALGGGLDVTESGIQTVKPYPPVGTNAMSVTASAFAFTNDMLASTVVRVTADGQAATNATMPVPARSGQVVTLINTGRHNIAFNPTAATSNIRTGTGISEIVFSYSANTFVSDGSFWYGNNRPR